jgi:hypothetical protein
VPPAVAHRSCRSRHFTLPRSSPHAFATSTSAAGSHPHGAPATSLLLLRTLSVYPADELAISPHAERRSYPRASRALPPVNHRPFTFAFTASSCASRPTTEFVSPGAVSFFAGRLPRFDHAGPTSLLSHGSPETTASRRCRLGRLTEW